jgi:hypothetical protein
MVDNAQIVEEMILASFPSLSPSEVLVYEGNTGKVTALAGRSSFSEGYRIIVNKRLREYSEEQKRGIFAHELIHLEDFSRSTYVPLEFITRLIPGHERRVERATDMKAIERGYGRQLFSFRVRRAEELRREFRKPSGNYLNPQEIEYYAREIGKW